MDPDLNKTDELQDLPVRKFRRPTARASDNFFMLSQNWQNYKIQM
jgi:hypothetical protein